MDASPKPPNTPARPPRPPAPAPAPVTLDSPVTAVRGVWTERARLLERLEIRTVGDLLLHRPRRHEDRRRFVGVRDLMLDEPATVRGRIVAAGVKTYRQGTKSVFEFVLDDGRGRLHCRWWNVPYLQGFFAVGDELLVHGKPTSLRPRTMDHPETEKIEEGDDAGLHVGRIVPIHPLTEGLSQRVLRSLVWQALEQFEDRVMEPPVSPAPGSGWPTRREAVRKLHFPDELAEAERARQRLALDEFVGLQLEIQRRRVNLERNATALPCAGNNALMRRFLGALGFPLTGAQTRVLREIRADLGGRFPMRRLLQGDVGSGKTAVAACAALMTLESGYHVALMAPTEILAGQLHGVFRRWLEPLGVPVRLRTGARRPGRGEVGLDDRDRPSVTVGTHALIEDAVVFDRLGLVIIDEQHRFGVAQREALLKKGVYPHLLVMTATPIPRTLGLTLYGDLDVSVIDELPAGRGRVRTHVREASALPKVWTFIRRELDAGRQAYVVYPRVLESEHDDVKAVTREFGRVAKELAPHRVGLLHGQLPPAEKEAVMESFRSGAVKVLVATSVIEVGVDVPNATVMLVENAGQFGLAQLHQLRGRVGRGGHESHCILVTDRRTESASERLKVLASIDDGFELAEADLRLRGAGELVGRQQSGGTGLRFGDLVRDRKLVEEARELARAHLRSDRVSAAAG